MTGDVGPCGDRIEPIGSHSPTLYCTLPAGHAGDHVDTRVGTTWSRDFAAGPDSTTETTTVSSTTSELVDVDGPDYLVLALSVAERLAAVVDRLTVALARLSDDRRA